MPPKHEPPLNSQAAKHDQSIRQRDATPSSTYQHSSTTTLRAGRHVVIWFDTAAAGGERSIYASAPFESPRATRKFSISTSESSTKTTVWNFPLALNTFGQMIQLLRISLSPSSNHCRIHAQGNCSTSIVIRRRRHSQTFTRLQFHCSQIYIRNAIKKGRHHFNPVIKFLT